MLDALAKKLLRLLEPNHPAELRWAVAKVLGETGLRDEEVSQALCEALNDPDQAVRLQVLATIGRLRIEQSLSLLLARVSEGGPEAEAAAQAAAHLGAKGTRALQDLMSQVAPGLRRWIAAALAAGGTSSSGSATIDVLLDKDPGVVDAALRSLMAEVPTLAAGQRRALADHILDLVQSKKKSSLAPASETALIRLLAALGDARGEAAFWLRVETLHSVELRAAALQALGASPSPKDSKRLKVLLNCAADPDFRVAAPALMILKPIPVSTRDMKDWLTLFEAPNDPARRFAIEKLTGQDTAAVAQALLRQLGHPDRALSDEARKRLAAMKHGREALAKALLGATSPEEAWILARAQSPFVREYAAALLAKILTQSFAYLEAGDRSAEALLFLLREADAPVLRTRLEVRALALRKKKAYDKAIIYLRLLGRDPACGEAIRFEMAACALKVSDHDLALETRNAEPCLQLFARLIHDHDVEPALRLKQAKWLGAEDLSYLGFHFAEGERQEREFGAQALRLAIARSPGSKIAKDAKRKLRTAGLD